MYAAAVRSCSSGQSGRASKVSSVTCQDPRNPTRLENSREKLSGAPCRSHSTKGEIIHQTGLHSLDLENDEWKLLDDTLHDPHHYFSRDADSNSPPTPKKTKPPGNKQSPKTTVKMEQVKSARHQNGENMKGAPNSTKQQILKKVSDINQDYRESDEWAKLDDEIHDDQHEFRPHHIAQDKNNPTLVNGHQANKDDIMEGDDPLTTLDGIIAAAKRMSFSIHDANGCEKNLEPLKVDRPGRAYGNRVDSLASHESNRSAGKDSSDERSSSTLKQQKKERNISLDETEASIQIKDQKPPQHLDDTSDEEVSQLLKTAHPVLPKETESQAQRTKSWAMRASTKQSGNRNS